MIIIDLDNCICDDEWRLKYILPDETDMALKYDTYHQLCSFDRAENLELLPDTERKIILTSRPIKYMYETEAWLKRHNVKYGILLMRAEGKEGIGSAELKRQMVNRLKMIGVTPLNITCAYDDRLDVLEMYKEFGIETEHLFINERE